MRNGIESSRRSLANLRTHAQRYCSGMDVSLQVDVVIVIARSTGIGYRSCEAPPAAGAAVVINYHRRSKEAEQLAARIRDSGGRALAVQADVSAEDDVDRLFAATLREFGTVHILVSNAGIQDD